MGNPYGAVGASRREVCALTPKWAATSSTEAAYGLVSLLSNMAPSTLAVSRCVALWQRGFGAAD